MALTPEERGKIRYHLGYPVVAQNTVISLGFPSGGHPAFLVEAAMNDVLPEGEPLVRRTLSECECIDAQLSDARRNRLQTAAVETIVLRSRDEIEDLEDQLDLWTDKLADILAVPKNPFSHVHQRLSGQIIVNDPS